MEPVSHKDIGPFGVTHPFGVTTRLHCRYTFIPRQIARLCDAIATHPGMRKHFPGKRPIRRNNRNNNGNMCQFQDACVISKHYSVHDVLPHDAPTDTRWRSCPGLVTGRVEDGTRVPRTRAETHESCRART